LKNAQAGVTVKYFSRNVRWPDKS